MIKLTMKVAQRIIAAAVLVLGLSAQAEEIKLFTHLETFQGKEINLQTDKLTHLIFIDAWSIYGGSGGEKVSEGLPVLFLQKSQQIWVQPQINVTLDQLSEFQGYFPTVSPLVLDEEFRMMRSLGIWNSPHHVLLQGDKPLFSGDLAELTAYAVEHFANQQQFVRWQESDAVAVNTDYKNMPIERVKFSIKSDQQFYEKIDVGAKAPTIEATSLQGKGLSLTALLTDKPVTLVFIDALCPMPHFPGCENKLEQLNKQVSADSSRYWLGVVNSYYVDEGVAKQFSDKFELALPLLFDTDNKIFQAYGVHATPYYIDIAQSGSIAYRGDESR